MVAEEWRTVVAAHDKYELTIDDDIPTLHIAQIANTHDFLHMLNATVSHGACSDLRTILWQHLATSDGVPNSATYIRNIQMIQTEIANFMEKFFACKDQQRFKYLLSQIEMKMNAESMSKLLEESFELLSGYIDDRKAQENASDSAVVINARNERVEKAKTLCKNLLDIFPLHVYENFIGVSLLQIMQLKEIYSTKFLKQDVNWLQGKYELKPATFGFWYEGRTGDRPVIHDKSQKPTNIVLSFVLTQTQQTQPNTKHYIVDLDVTPLTIATWTKNSMFTCTKHFAQQD